VRCKGQQEGTAETSRADDQDIRQSIRPG
jgi:hypothetical protein